LQYVAKQQPSITEGGVFANNFRLYRSSGFALNQRKIARFLANYSIITYDGSMIFLEKNGLSVITAIMATDDKLAAVLLQSVEMGNKMMGIMLYQYGAFLRGYS